MDKDLRYFRHLVLAFFLFFLSQLKAQDAPNLLSPQTRDFFHTVSHYTGAVSMSIPLYTYKDRDFELPVTLSYNASGFIPAKREGPVGLNWALNAGGAVVRKVNGVPDDCSGRDENGNRIMPTGIRIGAWADKLGNFNKQEIFELKEGEVRDGYWVANDIELMPDEFTFVAPGLSGWFFINYDGEVKCAGDKPFKVNVDNLAAQPARGTKIANSTITITADNGYVYVFGGGDAEKEWSINYMLASKDREIYEDSTAVVTSWHLSSITSPNGRTVYYHYRPFSRNTDYLYNLYNKHNILISTEMYVNWLSSAFANSYKPSQSLIITKTVYLSDITITGGPIIKLNYSENDKTFYKELRPVYNHEKDHSAYNQKNLRLNNLKVLYGKNEITSFKFNYAYIGNRSNDLFLNNYKRLVLESVVEKELLPYKFSYYGIDCAFPSPSTLGVDHWGFWNGKNDNKSLIPVSSNVNADIQYTSFERDPDTSLCRVGLLKSITYPTKGATFFYYESNSYNFCLDRRSDNNYLPKLYEKMGIAGGARIAAIENTTGETSLRTIFHYPTNGILMNWPRYAYFYHGVDLLGNMRRLIKGDGMSYSVNYYPGESFIHYPEVIEKKGDGSGYVKYRYTNYADTPDLMEYVVRDNLLCNNCLEELFLINQLSIRLSSRYFERGLLSEVWVYDNLDKVVEKKRMSYAGDGKEKKWLPFVELEKFEVVSSKVYHSPITLQQEVATQYFGADSITTITEYNYNPNHKGAYPESKTTITADGTQLKTLYRYVNATTRDNAEYAAMRVKNILNIPVETISYKNGVVTGASMIKFKTFEEMSARWRVYPSEVLKLESRAPVSDYDTVNIDHRMKAQLSYERYDTYGNVLQQRGADGLVVSYLWSADGLNKLAEIVGATYEEASAAATGIALSVELPENSYLDNMRRLRERLSPALVTTYTYKPLVGLSSQTNANGIITYYEYDELNRLQRVRDHRGAVIKEYGYHYSQN